MKILALASVFFLLSACGGGSSGVTRLDLPNTETTNTETTNAETANTETPTLDWVLGEYEPARNFANFCINPRPNSADLSGTFVDENNWLRSWSHETYLWYGELPDINPSTIANPIDYFEQLKTSATTGSGKPKDRFHYAQNSEEYNQYTETGVSAGYGFTYALVQSTPPRKAVIIFTEPNSPAALKNISRGAEIISIDNEAIVDGNPDILNAGLFPSIIGESHSFVIRDLNASSDRTVILQSAEITEVPVHTTTVITQDSKKIGYLLLNTFNVATAEQQLINAAYSFKYNQIDELVLDLRYNGGGYLVISAELGTMIADDKALGEVYTELSFNDKRSMENELYEFPSTAFGLSATKDTALPKLGLSRVYILSSNNTASASEYLINGLRGIDMEVILIGDTTTGKPYGFLPEDNCGTTYFTIQFKGQNANSYGDFADGFSPSEFDNGQDQVRGCQVADDLSNTLGDENENMLATALYHIENASCPTNSAGLASKPSHPLSAVQAEVIRPYPTELILQ